MLTHLINAALARARGRAPWVRQFGCSQLSMHPRNFVSKKIVRNYVHTSTLQVSRRELSHFTAPARFGGKSQGPRTFSEKRTTKPSLPFK